MKHFFAISLAMTVSLCSATFAQENAVQPIPPANDEAQYVEPQIQDSSLAANESNKQEFKNRHSLGIEYGFLTVSDFIGALSTALTSLFSLGNDEDPTLIVGAFSINYGYKVNDMFETGLVANFAMPTQDLFFLTFMPRAKINFNNNGFVNPYMELDAGVMAAIGKGVVPMGHLTLLGLEIGWVHFQLLGWGQRGLFNIGFNIPF